MTFPRSRIVFHCLLPVALVVLATFSYHHKWLEALDLFIFDHAQIAIPEIDSDDIVVIAIDDQSLSKIGRGPWDRATHAQLIENLKTFESGPIIFDLLLPEANVLGSLGDRALCL